MSKCGIEDSRSLEEDLALSDQPVTIRDFFAPMVIRLLERGLTVQETWKVMQGYLGKGQVEEISRAYRLQQKAKTAA